MKKYTKGFTLIELLVVIAIIGILASVVLVSLNSARVKARETRVISDVQQIRTALESGYNGTAYPDLKTDTTAAAASAGACVSTQTGINGWLNTGPQNVAINQLLNDACTQSSNNNDIILNTAGVAAPTAYAIYGRLISDTTKFFCIDSTGKTNPSASSIAATCP